MEEIPTFAKDILCLKGYKIQRELGRGGTATVYLLENSRFGEEFVLKWIHGISSCCKTGKTDKKTAVDDDSESSVSYQNEIETLKSLNFPHIIKIYDYFFGEDETSVFLILEYCPNGSLADYVATKGPLMKDKLYFIIENLLETVSFIHSKKVAHSDIKPSNILIDKHGRIKLADFGLSRCYNAGPQMCKKKIGSLTFMGPELFNSDSYDPFVADIWALGVTIYILAFGISPWPGSDLHTIKKAIEVSNISFPISANFNLKTLINSMLTYNPKKRPTATELLQNPLFKRVICPHQLSQVQGQSLPLVHTKQQRKKFISIATSTHALIPSSSSLQTNPLLYGRRGSQQPILKTFQVSQPSLKLTTKRSFAMIQRPLCNLSGL